MQGFSLLQTVFQSHLTRHWHALETPIMRAYILFFLRGCSEARKAVSLARLHEVRCGPGAILCLAGLCLRGSVAVRAQEEEFNANLPPSYSLAEEVAAEELVVALKSCVGCSSSACFLSHSCQPPVPQVRMPHWHNC